MVHYAYDENDFMIADSDTAAAVYDHRQNTTEELYLRVN